MVSSIFFPYSRIVSSRPGLDLGDDREAVAGGSPGEDRAVSSAPPRRSIPPSGSPWRRASSSLLSLRRHVYLLWTSSVGQKLSAAAGALLRLQIACDLRGHAAEHPRHTSGRTAARAPVRPPSSRRHRDRRDLRDLHRSLADDVAAEDPVAPARRSACRSRRAPVDDRARRASKRRPPTTTSCAARACASVSPTCAYSGSVKLPIGLGRLVEAQRRPAHGVRRRHEAVLHRLRDQHQAAGDVTGGEDVRPGSAGARRPDEAAGSRSRRLPRRDSSPAVSAAHRPPRRRARPRRSRAAILREVIRTPPGIRSNASIAPKSSRTSMPDARNPAATAAETSSSSVGRMRGPAWKSWTRAPKPLKTEATWRPWRRRR